MINAHESHKQALRQLLDRYGIERIDGSRKRCDQLVEKILRGDDRFNHNPSLNERGHQLRGRELQTVTFKVSITKRDDKQPFWSKIIPTRADAEHVACKNQRLIDREKWNHTIVIEEVPMSANDAESSMSQLRGKYTVIYAIMRDLRLSDDPREVPLHECYHHLAWVTADDPLAAEARCRADVLPGFSYQTLIMFEGHRMALDFGDHVLHHHFHTTEAP